MLLLNLQCDLTFRGFMYSCVYMNSDHSRIYNERVKMPINTHHSSADQIFIQEEGGEETPCLLIWTSSPQDPQCLVTQRFSCQEERFYQVNLQSVGPDNVECVFLDKRALHISGVQGCNAKDFCNKITPGKNKKS